MKLLNDILKINNRYSIKRVMATVTFIYVINLSVYVSMSEKSNGVGIVTSLLAFLCGLLAINEVGKKFENKEDIKNE